MKDKTNITTTEIEEGDYETVLNAVDRAAATLEDGASVPITIANHITQPLNDEQTNEEED